MDPNAALAELLRLSQDFNGQETDPNSPDTWTDACRMAELVDALDGWLQAGGFLPERWKR